VLSLVGAAGPVFSQSSRSGFFRLNVTATPRQVTADGQSQARLRLDVRDQNGQAAPDGTQVIVRTDLGSLSLGSTGRQSSLTVGTSGGFAAVYATSSAPGTATVTAQVADSRNVFYLDFLPPGEAIGPEERVLDVSGNWVGYCLSLGLIEARDQAQIRTGRIVLEVAGVVQLSVETLILKAQKVVIRRGQAKLEGEDLYYDLGAKRGVLRRFGPDGVIERVFFDSVGMRPLEKEWEIPGDAFRLDRREGDMWLLAKSISYFVREKVVLRRGSMWSQGQKVLSFPPYWIVALPGYTGASNSQVVGLSSDGGIALDFPFFYRVTNTATGSVKIQNGAQSSSFTSRSGWSLGLEEEYRTGSGVEGAFEVGGLLHPDWGVSWTDTRPLFSTALSSTNIGMPDHRSLFADWNLFDQRAGGRVSVRGYYNAPVGFETTYGLTGDWLEDPRPIGTHNLTYRFGTSLGGVQYSDDPAPVLAGEVYSELSLGSRPAGRRTRFHPMVSNTYSWDTSGFGVNSLRGDLRMTHDFTRSCALGLDYGAEWRQGDFLDQSTLQTVSLDLRANHGAKWLTFIDATLDVTHQDVYAYANLDYYLNPRWRWGMHGTYYDFDSALYRDLELSLGRVIGDREISLVYSTNTGDLWMSLGGFTSH
jgi:hypothetical protein